VANERVASVKLTLNGAVAISSLKQIGQEGERAAKKVESSFKRAGVAGLKAMGGAAREMGSAIKNTIKTAATLGGAFSMAGGIKSAIDMTSKFRDIAATIKAGTGAVTDWRSVMIDVQGVAIATGQSTGELGDAFRGLFDEVGDADFAKAALKVIAVQATATGDSIGTLSSIAGTMNEKFGVTAKELPEALAIAKGLGSKGGITFDEMSEKLGVLGASAKKAGMTGIPGFQRLIALANSGDDALGGLKKNVAAVTSFLDKLGDSGQRKQIKTMFGVDVNDAKGKAKDATKVLGEIFGKTGGKKESLEKVFTGEEGKLIISLGQKYATAFAAAEGDVKTKSKAALKAYEDALNEAGKTAYDHAEVERDFADRMQDPKAKLQAALAQLEAAFTKPEMIASINKLAQMLPELANKLSKLLGFVVEHPAASLAIAGGIKLGAPALEAAMGAGAKSFLAAAMDTIKTTTPVDKFRGAPGQLGVVGRGLAVAGAGLAGYEIGSAYAGGVVDPLANESGKKANDLRSATLATDLNTSGKFSKEGAESSLGNLRTRLDEAKKDKEFSWKDVASLGLRRLGTSSDKEVEQGEAVYAKGKEALDKMAPSVKTTTDVVVELGKAATEATAALRGVSQGASGSPSGGGAVRGPMPRGPVTPGYVPRG